MARVPVAMAPATPVDRPDADFGEASRRAPGEGLRVLLVGFQDQDNLGLRYLTAAAGHRGHACSIVTYHDDPATLLDEVRRARPDVVGFSLIFQYMAPAFATVIDALRTDGFTGHTTMGGHYPSFDPELVLARMPGLDSVVRFEGEATFVELLGRLEAGSDWRDLDGLAWRRDDGQVVLNPLRPSIEDLDVLPRPFRADVDYERQPLPTASMLGSRGCPWNCSFCSIRPFYEAQGGPLRRLRAPAAVAGEMLELFRDRGVTTFLFQDDDFLATGRRGRRWAVDLAEAIARTEMHGRISIKVSCRSDEVEEESLRALRDLGGLTHVYLGVESGDADALVHLNKQLKPEAHLRAAAIIRRLGLSFDFGYMLLEPYSTFDSIEANIDFLDELAGDGWTVSTFCRTLPYAGTAIERRLAAEGRLLGTPFDPDYRFLDPRIDVFYDWLLQTFHRRNFTDDGLCHLLRGLQFELHLRGGGRRTASDAERAVGRCLTAVANRVATHTLRAALHWCRDHSLDELERDRELLDGLRLHEQQEEARLEAEVTAFYRQVRRDEGAIHPAGGFERSWTLATSS